ncbi:hypothetical protein [Muricoccus aerilatus]|uniref:hypothetical protein n=1 Tax=Muricoccus aerilatus TaxID=452982 RepID=UPI0012ECA11D|nr:hypothetical protein [Roseomonas aerilata]
MMPKNLAGAGFAALTGTTVPVRIIDVGADPIEGTPACVPLLESRAAEPMPA